MPRFVGRGPGYDFAVGKKWMKQVGRVEIPRATFLAVLESDQGAIRQSPKQKRKKPNAPHLRFGLRFQLVLETFAAITSATTINPTNSSTNVTITRIDCTRNTRRRWPNPSIR